MREYFPPLNVRSKWIAHQRNMQKDDIVALLDPEQPRGTWRFVRVEVIPGANGVVRSTKGKIALIKEADNRVVTTHHRPIHKMILLLSADESMWPQACPGPAVYTK